MKNDPAFPRGMREPRFRVWEQLEKRMREDVSLPLLYDAYKSKLILTLNDVFSTPLGVVFMQFTDLKDKNGVKIFERDVIHLESTYETDDPVDCNSMVLFQDGAFRLDFHAMPLNGKLLENDGNWLLEVIGNIYENPELLEEPKNA